MPGLDHGINLAGDGQDQRGFAAPIRSQNRHVLAGANVQVHVVQHDAVAARHVDIFELEELFGIEVWIDFFAVIG